MNTAGNKRQVVTVRQDFSSEENAFVAIDKPFDIDKDDLEVIDYFIELQVENNRKRFIPTLVSNRREIIGIYQDNNRRVSLLNIPPFCGDIPESILRLDALETLNLRYCECVPQWIAEFKNLKKIILPESSTEIHDEIGELIGLRTLEVCRSKITALPSIIGRLHNLQTLNLAHTRNLLSLPDAIGGLGNLVQLKLTESCVSSLPPAIGRLQNLRELDLHMAIYLSGLPDEIGNFSNLEKLNLGHTPIKSLPPSIGLLRNLKELVLCGTWKLTSLPKEIGDLENLIRLTLTFSPIASLPSSIGQLRNLEVLDLSNTEHLSTVPKEIGELGNLIRLQLNQSFISSLPASIGQLQNLQELDLSHTECLTFLPEEIGDLESLRRVSILGSHFVRVAKDDFWCLVSLRRARLRRTLRPASESTLKAQFPILLQNATAAINGKWIRLAGDEYMEPFAAHDAIYQLLIENGDTLAKLITR